MEEEKAKEQRKLEREQKRELREAEKKKKEEERKSKALEREKKKAQLEEDERAAKRKEKSKVTKVFVTRSKGHNCESGYSPQHSESGVNECTVCFGNYKDDLSEDGTPTRGWIQCTDNECSKWMHEDCISKDGDIMICVCNAVFS